MRIATNIVLTCMTLALWPALLVAADEPPALSHNPFSRPSSEVIRAESVVLESEDGSGPNIPLQATMIGSVNRLANVGGRILKTGDEFEGYRLVDIREQYVVFKKAGRPITVYVKPLLADNEEQD